MRDVSRRDFFRRFGHRIADSIDRRALEKVTPTFAVENSESREERWIFVGRLSEMRPGATVDVEVNGAEFQLHASEVGFWMTNRSGDRVALRLSSGGTIVSRPDELWPQGRIISHASGEPLDVEIQCSASATNEETNHD